MTNILLFKIENLIRNSYTHIARVGSSNFETKGKKQCMLAKV